MSRGPERHAEERLRSALWGVSLAVYLGSAVELGLAEHYEGWRQWMALVAVGLGLAVSAWAWRRPGPGVLAAVRWLSVAVLAVGALGVGFHLWGNLTFSLDVAPLETTAGRAWDTLTGGNPAFAPGMLAVAAALSLAATWAHPRLRQSGDGERPVRTRA